MARKKSVPPIRRQHSQEFKDEAVRLALLREKPLTEIARDLGLRKEQLRTWVRLAQGAKATRAPGTSQDEEVRLLRRRVRELEEEREILGKAMAFFAKRNG